jgi:adenylosuccinate lyase
MVVGGMRVYPERMRENLELTHGAVFSQSVLTALVEAGVRRDTAYRIVQRAAQAAWDERRSFRELLEQDAEAAERLGPEKLDELFDYGRFLRNVPDVFERLDALVA